MTRTKKILFTLLILVILAAVALYSWKTAKAPMNDNHTDETPTPSPAATPNPTPTPAPTPTPVSTSTIGTLMGQADTTTLHINKILVYDSTGKKLITSTTLNSSGGYSVDLLPGNYKIDYQASPDPYPHSPESFTIVAGQTHEVDYIVQN